LRLNQKSQSSFLSQITQIGDLNDELRSAANNNDIMAVKVSERSERALIEDDNTYSR